MATLWAFLMALTLGQQLPPQHRPNATPQEATKFKLLTLSNGVTKIGASWGGKIYETPTHTKVYLYIVHLDSREATRKEYEDELKGATKIINQGKFRINPLPRNTGP